MGIFSFYNFLLIITVAAYLTTSKYYIFDRVYDTIHTVIDELFHLPQGMAYCLKNYEYWDPKITTLPGLYLVSSAIMSHIGCNTYNLRLVNLIASAVNLILFSSILKFTYEYSRESELKIVWQALNLTLLPPLYFFSHVYYTDTLSLTFLLAFCRLSLTNKYKLPIILFGLWSILMRQTNIVWVVLMLGHKILDIYVKSSRVNGNEFLSDTPTYPRRGINLMHIDKSKQKRYYSLHDLYIATRYHLKTKLQTFKYYLTFDDMLAIVCYLTVMICFISFVFINGSIVVGDKEAHSATIHIPQIFYFLVFYGFFALPFVVTQTVATLYLIKDNWKKFLLLHALFLIIVHFNTVEHPYLLADNRHYTFYVWNRWYGKYVWAKYASVPVYVFLLFNLYSNLEDQNCISFLFPYSVCAILVLSLQKMIEVRYFLIPYIILRLRFPRPNSMIVMCETIWYIFLIQTTFNVFFDKEIYWPDFDYAQRIIW